MNKLYYKDKFVGEFETNEELEKLKENFKTEISKKILEIDELAKELYEKREMDTDEDYLNFLKKVNPDFVEKLDEVKNILFKNEFIKYVFFGKSISMISIKITDEKAKRGTNVYSFFSLFMGLMTNKYDENFRIETVEIEN